MKMIDEDNLPSDWNRVFMSYFTGIGGYSRMMDAFEPGFLSFFEVLPWDVYLDGNMLSIYE